VNKAPAVLVRNDANVNDSNNLQCIFLLLSLQHTSITQWQPAMPYTAVVFLMIVVAITGGIVFVLAMMVR
jgi:hypothetical protein